MDLESSLRCIQTLSDLPKLVIELGHQRLWERVPDQVWTRRGNLPLEVWVVGRSGEVPWFGLESSTPARDARLLARRISHRGKVALVVALDSCSRLLAVAAAFDRCPVLELNLSTPNPEAVAALSRLTGAWEGGPLGYAARSAEALAAEPVGQRFFRAFRATLDQMTSGLPRHLPASEGQVLVLLQLTRVLFLYFIQAKGWLDGRDDFLAQQIDQCLSRRRRIHRDVLRPLFFGTLNQKAGQRTRGAQRFGAVPFLNGGLFEPHPLERRWRCDISNDLWQDAFSSLFERFHFTVAEGKDRGYVAPDMLGRVFEGVMDPDARRASGTFYTPAALVSRILDAALIALLSRKLGCTEAEADRRIRDPDPMVSTVVSSLTILDPAVGSGAFLLCALERLSRVGALHSSITESKRKVLEQSLFGVDRNATAVRLTELRLWLAVIADDPADHAERVHPLPNLDCLIRQGDSLFEPAGLGLSQGMGDPAQELARELSQARREVVGTAGASKRQILRRLRAIELRALGRSIDAAEERHFAAIGECFEHARSRDLFGQRRGLDRELSRRLAELRSSLRELRRARRRLARDGDIPWFHYQSHFADVFAEGGFDLVVGNPPWLRSESIPTPVKRRLMGRYQWFRARSHGYGNSPDLALAFVERAFELAAPNGVVAMLVPAKVATTSSSVAARHGLASATTLHVVADLTDGQEAKFDATVYPLALIAGKATPPQSHEVRTDLSLTSGVRIRQADLSGGAPWVLIPGLHQILAALEHDHPTLAETTPCHLGVKTGLNRVFLNPPPDLEPEVIRCAVRGRDVTPFRFRCRTTILWTHDHLGRPLAQLPPKARAYATKLEPLLRARRDYSGGPAWVLFRTRAGVAPHRVVWSDVARQIAAVALTSRHDSRCIPLNSCYIAPLPDALRAHALTAWLNSTWIRSLARIRAVPASNGFARFNAQVMGGLPLPAAALSDPALARLGRMGRAGIPVQSDLDEVTAHHLSLTASAQRALRAIVDCRTGNRR